MKNSGQFIHQLIRFNTRQVGFFMTGAPEVGSSNKTIEVDYPVDKLT